MRLPFATATSRSTLSKVEYLQALPETTKYQVDTWRGLVNLMGGRNSIALDGSHSSDGVTIKTLLFGEVETMLPIHMMEPQSRITYRIGRCAGKQGLRPSVGNQADVERSSTGTDFSNQAHGDHNTEEYTHRCPHGAISEIKQKATRTKWSKEEYIDVIEAHYRALLNPKIYQPL